MIFRQKAIRILTYNISNSIQYGGLLYPLKYLETLSRGMELYAAFHDNTRNSNNQSSKKYLSETELNAIIVS